eukprot:1672970-Prymnesium_polylepis.1
MAVASARALRAVGVDGGHAAGGHVRCGLRAEGVRGDGVGAGCGGGWHQGRAGSGRMVWLAAWVDVVWLAHSSSAGGAHP